MNKEKRKDGEFGPDFFRKRGCGRCEHLEDGLHCRPGADRLKEVGWYGLPRYGSKVPGFPGKSGGTADNFALSHWLGAFFIADYSKGAFI